MDFKEYSELFHSTERGHRASHSSRPTPTQQKDPKISRPDPKLSPKITVDQGDMLLVARFMKVWNAMAFKPEQSSSIADQLYRRMERCCAREFNINYRPGCCNPFNRSYSFNTDPSLRDDIKAFLNKYESYYKNDPNYLLNREKKYLEGLSNYAAKVNKRR